MNNSTINMTRRSPRLCGEFGNWRSYTMKFAAIDFETANTGEKSICAAGLAVFENGELAESLYWLIKPPEGYGWFRDDFIEIHGIRHTDVQDQPEFPAIAPEIFSRLAGADVVVAHNASFDMRMLRGTAGHFGLEIPPFDYLCTYRLAGKIWPQLPDHQLCTVAAHVGHSFNHHHAGEDAEAAGRILLAMMQERKVAGPKELAELAGLRTGALP